MKTILVSLAHLERVEDAIEAAIDIGRENDSHIIGYYPIPGVSIMVASAPGSYYPPDDRLKTLYEDHLPDIKLKFEDRMRRSGLNYEWREDYRYEPGLIKGILEHGREADLIVMAHDKAGSKQAAEEAGFVADVIMGAGRPVLVIPPGTGKFFKLDKIGIGWNASREACRAAFDSLPLLLSAKDVFLAWVNPAKKLGNGGKLPGAELAAALGRHNVTVTTKGLSNRSKTSKALISFVEEESIDLLVIGAYGRSRLRERILGGVTEHMLRNLPCPVLFAN